MARVEQACVALGAVLIVGGAGWAFAPAAPIIAGALLIASAVDRGGKS